MNPTTEATVDAPERTTSEQKAYLEGKKEAVDTLLYAVAIASLAVAVGADATSALVGIGDGLDASSKELDKRIAALAEAPNEAPAEDEKTPLTAADLDDMGVGSKVVETDNYGNGCSYNWIKGERGWGCETTEGDYSGANLIEAFPRSVFTKK